MRVLCLHGRGSNNEIFKLQTASFRADLPDFSYDFIQGTIPHTEGNWSLFTTSFTNLPLYNYYNPLSPRSILQTEDEIMEIIEEEGPFDGVIGYSAGAALAAQLLIRDLRENPWKLPHERIFRWAVFINGGTPLEVFYTSGVLAKEGAIYESAAAKEAAAIFLRPSNIRARKGTERHPDYDPMQIMRDLKALQTRQLSDSRLFMTDGVMGFSRYDADVQGTLIDIPTLHIRNPTDKNPNLGLKLMEMCDQSLVTEFFHGHDHDFPRGYTEMKKIAQMIREVSERAE
ncbi:hypothetical protein AJ80_03732 [Polytolypa hystricis UAMH7299]|uniref:Serine hydrolase domain-containing protein n=1 Tax=Polytolypa hystricis (strain UAMH7299) TaxID=1447883 RepID=A0A2B7YGS5_POLH7|nr:hypothetical protein AJ80_03732 [Polytolypa hystricis UAMH7299]